MANNYVEFSETLTIESEEERKWVLDILDRCEKYMVCGEVEGEPPKDLPKEAISMMQDWGCIGFRWEAEDDYIWFYSEESGDTAVLEHIVQAFLKKFHPRRCWYVEGAYRCSKPRIGEFGGYAVFVTANDIKWVNTCVWVLNEIMEFRRRDRCEGCKHAYNSPIDGLHCTLTKGLTIKVDKCPNGKVLPDDLRL